MLRLMSRVVVNGNCRAVPSTSTILITIISAVEQTTKNSQRRSRFATLSSSNDTKAETKTTVHTSGSSSYVLGESKNTSVLQSKYLELVRKSNVSKDEHQINALQTLDRLYEEIMSNENQGQIKVDDSLNSSSSSSWISNLMSSFGGIQSQVDQIAISAPKGVYLHGGVGCGKTFCMNLFYDTLLPQLPPQHIQKVHFHAFMLHVHRSMHLIKQDQKKNSQCKDYVLSTVIDQLMEQGKIICFDEFQVTDVADALILRQLFTGMLNRGAIFVATSNRAPHDLYLNGLQRDRFIPFIDLLEKKCEIVSMWESDTDYRLVQRSTTESHNNQDSNTVYFVGDKERQNFERVYKKCIQPTIMESIHIPSTSGGERTVRIPLACLEYGVARFSFDHLCRKAMGASDYLAIGQTFHTVFIEDVPAHLTLNDVNIVRRFIVLIDALYECHVKVVIHAQSIPEKIFTVDLQSKHNDESFAFDRTRSRLQEMSSITYLKRQRKERNNIDRNKCSDEVIDVDDRDFRHNRNTSNTTSSI